MTKEGFRIILVKELSKHDVLMADSRLVTLIMSVAEPLFEEIEKLKVDEAYWLDRYGLEVHRTIAAEKEIGSLINDRDQWKQQALDSTYHSSQVHAELLIAKSDIQSLTLLVEQLKTQVQYYEIECQSLDKKVKELESTITHDENVRLEEGEWI